MQQEAVQEVDQLLVCEGVLCIATWELAFALAAEQPAAAVAWSCSACILPFCISFGSSHGLQLYLYSSV